tara:strand:- start:150 stop:293 length:144 start_codon:yes stop_codon:yes gene_type:complete
MEDNSKINNINSEDFNKNSEDSDYENLVSRLQEISSAIALLGKIISR